MSKVYLSKSNASNFEVYSLVKKKLQEMGHQIVEFSGGTYSPKPMLECEYLFIVPPERIIGAPGSKSPNSTRFSFGDHSSCGTYELGRGQSDQIKTWMLEKGLTDDTDQFDEDDKEYGESYDMMDAEKRKSIIILKEISIDDKGKTHLYCDNINDLVVDKVDWKLEWGHPDPCEMDLCVESFFPEPDSTSVMSWTSNSLPAKTGKPLLATCSVYNII